MDYVLLSAAERKRKGVRVTFLGTRVFEPFAFPEVAMISDSENMICFSLSDPCPDSLQ